MTAMMPTTSTAVGQPPRKNTPSVSAMLRSLARIARNASTPTTPIDTSTCHHRTTRSASACTPTPARSAMTRAMIGVPNAGHSACDHTGR